ncbi:hypothetical protein BSPLISOX_646 [uncultured Gammaproteobacteria bacterium]|nr:hypothetical protein [uncultured Gammaproteobacteria bacterium]CAC9450384.1 hypothetical protein [uncultured Gammaproteobacteria bacterium]VVH65163.1 hypothetical protein BSPLISOX_646 [uncultured Gammaproteobacteria bacterium]
MLTKRFTMIKIQGFNPMSDRHWQRDNEILKKATVLFAMDNQNTL